MPRRAGGQHKKKTTEEGTGTKGATHFEVLVWSSADHQLPTGLGAFCLEFCN